MTRNDARGGAGNREPGAGTAVVWLVAQLRGWLVFASTILAGHTASMAADVAWPASLTNTRGNNLVGDGAGAPGFVDGQSGDKVGGGPRPVIDARLGPLADNGGPVPTQLPLFDSPAIDAGATQEV